jgi:hypothetical protein
MLFMRETDKHMVQEESLETWGVLKQNEILNSAPTPTKARCSCWSHLAPIVVNLLLFFPFRHKH